MLCLASAGGSGMIAGPALQYSCQDAFLEKLSKHAFMSVKIGNIESNVIRPEVRSVSSIDLPNTSCSILY